MLRALGLGVISASAKRCTTSATTTSNMISCIQRSAAAVGRSPSLGARVLASTSRAAAAPPHLPLLAPNLTSSTASSLSRISRSIVAPGSRAPSSGAALVRPVFTRAAVMSGMRKSPSSLLTRGIGNGSSGQSQVIQIRVPEFLRRPELLFSKRYIKWMLYAGFVFTSFAGMMQRVARARPSCHTLSRSISTLRPSFIGYTCLCAALVVARSDLDSDGASVVPSSEWTLSVHVQCRCGTYTTRTLTQ